MPQQYMDPISSLRKIARELSQIGVELQESQELVSRINGASFLINWIADGLERQIQYSQRRQIRKELNG